MANGKQVDAKRANEVLSTLVGLPVAYARLSSGYVIGLELGQLSPDPSLRPRVGDLRFSGKVTLNADASLWSINHATLGHFEAKVGTPEPLLWKLLGLIRGRVRLCQTTASQVLELTTDLGVELSITADERGLSLEYWDVLFEDNHYLAAWPKRSFVESSDGVLRLPNSIENVAE